MSEYRDEVNEAVRRLAAKIPCAEREMRELVELGVRLGLEAAAACTVERKLVALLEYPPVRESRAEHEAAVRQRVAQEIRALASAAVLKAKS